MKSYVRGFWVLEIAIVLACLGCVLGFAIHKTSDLQNQRQSAYDSAKSEAMKMGGHWASVVNAMSECHKELGPFAITQIAGVGNNDLYLCPKVVVSLRALNGAAGDGEMLVKRNGIKRAYEAGFWRGASAAVYAEATGNPLLVAFLI